MVKYDWEQIISEINRERGWKMSEKSPSDIILEKTREHSASMGVTGVFEWDDVLFAINETRNQTLAQVEKIIDKIHFKLKDSVSVIREDYNYLLSELEDAFTEGKEEIKQLETQETDTSIAKGVVSRPDVCNHVSTHAQEIRKKYGIICQDCKVKE